MRTFTVRSSDIARCPHRILTVEHYYEDGNCKCTDTSALAETRSYVVRWTIDIEDVNSPREAAAKALEIQRDPESIAIVFDVAPVVTRGTAHSIIGEYTSVDLDEAP